jgi:uncharacterized protein (TIGR03546 family)
MDAWLSWPLRWLLKPFIASCSPQQVALGLALGMVVGLVPKGNLTAAALGVVLLAANVNLGAAALAVFCFSWIGWLIDPVSHTVGAMLLFAQPLVPVWTWLYRLPLGPWLALNNTVVLGSLTLGLALAWPAYHFARKTAAAQLPKLSERLRAHSFARAVFDLPPPPREGARA